MKKLLSVLSTALLATSGVLSIAVNKTYEPITHHKDNVSKEGIDWDHVENYFKEDSFQTLYQTNVLTNANNQPITSEVINKVQEKSLEYVNDFKTKNFNLNQITNYLKTNVKDFDQHFKLDHKNETLKLNSYSLLQTTNKDLDKEKTITNTLNAVNKLKIVNTGIYTAATIAEIAAAGFWAAAWWFGISVPWAIAATALGAALFTVYYAINTFLIDNDISNKNLWDDLLWAKDITFFASSVSYSLIYNTAVLVAEGTLTATSWAVPAAFAAIGVLFGTWAWLKLYTEDII
ncbi:hypothetical protein S100390_v1c07560 [Spiroplasma sp. NBRC 100390]|uniref:hypothetical protein n=1 Tax=unclassified Spiroplasma TaxID=2637901 RepID=UPI000892A2A4|nr:MULTISPECIES: hypothetical protein [unclassified Spiroplasma]AOX44092.1 hypothetical protein STU14_v1c07560 [Spiroplasma sp. TU-14]APE13562.1 hypothetical protein S100390_v1c07560 [Spiroplasma sp. NBRC 100390]